MAMGRAGVDPTAPPRYDDIDRKRSNLMEFGAAMFFTD
jgi:hypothetical protein